MKQYYSLWRIMIGTFKQAKSKNVGEHIFTERFKTLLVSSSSNDDETSHALKRLVEICLLTFWLFALY